MKITGVSSVAEPDDFAVGTDLTHAFEGITLSVDPYSDRKVVVADGYSSHLDQNFASTGYSVFGQDSDQFPQWQFWDQQQLGSLRIDFIHGTDFFQIDLGAEDDDWGQLAAYDVEGNLIASQAFGDPVNFLGPNEYISPSISFDDARIAYVTVGGADGEGMFLDNLYFGVVGSSSADTMKGTSASDHYNGLAGNDRIEGLAGNDTLIGGAGLDNILGGPGADSITGSGGADKLTGGLDADLFIYLASTDTGAGSSTRDTITDFHHSEGDRIDLSAIDADNTADGDQAFFYIGKSAFSGMAGELRFSGSVLSGDVDGDQQADFALALPHVTSPDPGSDWVL